MWESFLFTSSRSLLTDPLCLCNMTCCLHALSTCDCSLHSLSMGRVVVFYSHTLLYYIGKGDGGYRGEKVWLFAHAPWKRLWGREGEQKGGRRADARQPTTYTTMPFTATLTQTSSPNLIYTPRANTSLYDSRAHPHWRKQILFSSEHFNVNIPVSWIHLPFQSVSNNYWSKVPVAANRWSILRQPQDLRIFKLYISFRFDTSYMLREGHYQIQTNTRPTCSRRQESIHHIRKSQYHKAFLKVIRLHV